MSDRRRAGVWQRFFGFLLLRFRSRDVCISGETLQRLKSHENRTIWPKSAQTLSPIGQWMSQSQGNITSDEAKSVRTRQNASTTPLATHLQKVSQCNISRRCCVLLPLSCWLACRLRAAHNRRREWWRWCLGGGGAIMCGWRELYI